MKVELVIEINQNNASEVKAVQTCIQYYNLVKAYLPIISSKAEIKEVLNALEECKSYCRTHAKNKDGKVIYTFEYNDETINAAETTMNIASLAAELLGGK